MKKILMYAVALAAGFSAMAQNENINIFRNDSEKVTSFKASEIQSIKHTDGSAATGFQNLEIVGTNGKTTNIELSIIDSVQTRLTNLPVFYVNLQDYHNWTELQGSKDDKHPATLRMEGNGMFDDLAEQTVEFRGRGNSTWNMPKKPYRFKMDKKASVCGLPKDKNFVLLANYIDCTLMRNAIAYWVANFLEMPYSNHAVPVKVIFNGIDKGAYLLTEKIGIGGGSVDIDENTGILFELDSNYDEDFKFKYSKNGITLPVMVKDPDLTDIEFPEGYTTADQYFQAWKADFTEMADAVITSNADADLSQYINLDALASFFVVQALACNNEVQHPKSFYIHKKALGKGEVYQFGPIWDFDWAYTYNGTTPENASPTRLLASSNGDYQGGSFIQALFRNNAFRTIYKQKWDYFVAEGYPLLKKYMEDYAYNIEVQAINNGKLWPDDNSVSWKKTVSSLEFRSNYDKLKKWIEDRINFCNTHTNFGIY